MNTNQSSRLFSRSKPILNENNPNLILTKQNQSHQIHRSMSTSNYIDLTNPLSKQSIINNQLNTINFLYEYLQNENHDVLIDLLERIVQQINIDQYSYSAINNNHFHLSPTLNPNFQLSNNKEKKTKKHKSDENGKKESKKEDILQDNEIINKKAKKDKTKKIEETTTTTDSQMSTDSPVSTYTNHYKTSPETNGFSSLSIPVPHSGGSSTIGFMSPNPPLAHLSQVQQQLQSLSQMARDGDEILITLSVNTLTQKQPINTQQNSYLVQPSNQTMTTPAEFTMPRNLEIVAKGFARIQNEHSQPFIPSINQQQQPMIHSYTQPTPMMPYPPFAPRYSAPCNSINGPPSTPIGPPIHPIKPSSNPIMPGGFVQPPNCTDFMINRRNNFDNTHHRSHLNTGKCDYLCQSSFYQPDFRRRPSPGQITNPSPLLNFSAKRSSKHKTKIKYNEEHNIISENINRTFSSIY
ncbi:unnamed protein product [Adineta steineri]|uniref:Uncharacterized protein n=1 Tax=Adineta steineri TaxID=433720 RepID=A0A815M4R0_9BILA|nr:unnamed protein product [Adineta steineri]